MTHRPCAAGDEHDLALERARLQPARSVLGHRQGAVCRHGRDTEAGTYIEADPVGESDDAFGRQVGVLLGGAGGPFVTGQVHPDPVADQQAAHSLTDGVDHACAVLVGDDLLKRR